MALNTFGGMLLAVLALPALLHHVRSANDAADAAATIDSGDTAQALLVVGVVRTLPALCSTVSAAVQRRHLYAWALFAPKFVFEAFFLVLTDLVLVILSWLCQ